MLDPKDFEALQKMMESVVGARVTESETRMDARIAESEARMDARIAESEARMETMLDARIAESEARMETMLDARIAESEARMETMLDTRIAKSEARMESMLTVKIKEAENLLLEEIDRTQTKLENKINLLNENLDKLEQYYRISKLENDNTTVLLKLMEGLAKRVEDLEKKIA